MTWPFENDTSAITKKLAKESLKSEKRRNFMIIIAISLAAFLMSMCGTLFFAFQESQNNMATFQASYDNPVSYTHLVGKCDGQHPQPAGHRCRWVADMSSCRKTCAAMAD